MRECFICGEVALNKHGDRHYCQSCILRIHLEQPPQTYLKERYTGAKKYKLEIYGDGVVGIETPGRRNSSVRVRGLFLDRELLGKRIREAAQSIVNEMVEQVRQEKRCKRKR